MTCYCNSEGLLMSECTVMENIDQQKSCEFYEAKPFDYKKRCVHLRFNEFCTCIKAKDKGLILPTVYS